jgi:FkbM family methyltransferase
MSPPVSYAQRFEDLYLMRCFGERADGFYIDIGSGHPVYDNVSFAFYLSGWRGITVEPNPWLARLTRAVRPRDCHVEGVVGAAAGEMTFYVVDDYHGFSTTIAAHAEQARTEYGKGSQALTVPVATLAQLCREQQAPATFDFLKVDVEGAEPDVLLSGDWRAYRPKVIVVEALAPFTQAPAWDAWEPFLAGHGYRYVWFDTLNRYYLAAEAEELAPCFASAPASFDTFQFRDVKPALTDEAHPDHRLATLLSGSLARNAMIRLPVLERDFVFALVTADIPAAALDAPAGPAEIASAVARLFGVGAPAAVDLRLPPNQRLRDVYAALIDSEPFRAACGRISASYAW